MLISIIENSELSWLLFETSLTYSTGYTLNEQVNKIEKFTCSLNYNQLLTVNTYYSVDPSDSDPSKSSLLAPN